MLSQWLLKAIMTLLIIIVIKVIKKHGQLDGNLV